MPYSSLTETCAPQQSSAEQSNGQEFKTKKARGCLGQVEEAAEHMVQENGGHGRNMDFRL